MSYLVPLDEIAEDDLVQELLLRSRRRYQGVCDYCARPATEPPCKFPARHGQGRTLAEEIQRYSAKFCE